METVNNVAPFLCGLLVGVFAAGWLIAGVEGSWQDRARPGCAARSSVLVSASHDYGICQRTDGTIFVVHAGGGK